MINRLGLIWGGCRRARLLLWLYLAFTAPCNAGSPMFEAGQDAYLNGDIQAALTLWRPLAQHGDIDAQFALGTIFYGGIGVPIDLTESSYWFLRAAQQGFAPAQYNMGNAYMRGEGVRQNDKLAFQWWRKAAIQNFPAAQYNLATAYLQGKGVEKDLDKARALFRQSAANGHYPAKLALEELDSTEKPATAAPGKPPAGAGETACSEWLGRQNPRQYTLQLMSSTARSDALGVLDRYPLDPHAICAYKKDETQRYMLLYGVFENRTAAQQAVSALPGELRQNKPWIRRIRAVRSQLSVNQGS